MCEDQIYYFHTSNNNFIAVIQSCYQASLEKNEPGYMYWTLLLQFLDNYLNLACCTTMISIYK